MKRPQARARVAARPDVSTLAALAAAARLGDARASDALWECCSGVARQVARRWASNGAEVEDLSQEALLHAVESFGALRDLASLMSWLHVVVKRSVTRDVRKVRRKRRLMSGGSDPEVLPALDAPSDFQVDLRRLLATLGGLPEEERSCLWLRRGEGLRIDEIAREMALSPSTIQRRLHVAERRLARRIDR